VVVPEVGHHFLLMSEAAGAYLKEHYLNNNAVNQYQTSYSTLLSEKDNFSSTNLT
jgi:hypothetical protein